MSKTLTLSELEQKIAELNKQRDELLASQEKEKNDRIRETIVELENKADELWAKYTETQNLADNIYDEFCEVCGQLKEVSKQVVLDFPTNLFSASVVPKNIDIEIDKLFNVF